MAKAGQAGTVEALGRVPLFSGLTKRQLSRIADLCFEADYGPGDVILREGEREAQHMAVITQGSAGVVAKGRTITSVGPGDIVGEMALLDGMPRSAAVVAETPVSAIVLYRTAFTHLLETVPTMYPRLLVSLAQRLRACDHRASTLG
jgi:CRP/FNR family transcriptional regulator, cyclic AMP receptor protein